MSSESAADKRARRKARYGWHKPLWRDRLFWLAICLTIVFVALESTFSPRTSALDWIALTFQAVITWMLVSALLRIRRALPRALVDGYVEADEKAKAKPSGKSTGEAIARTSGKTIGRAMGAYKNAQRKD